MLKRRIKQRREALGLTQDELGERIGVNKQSVYRYESGENEPAAAVLVKLARELDVTADWLLGLVDDPKAHLTEEALSPIERKLIAALRKGLIIEAMAAAVEIAKTNSDKKSGVPRKEPVN